MRLFVKHYQVKKSWSFELKKRIVYQKKNLLSHKLYGSKSLLIKMSIDVVESISDKVSEYI